MAQGDLLFGQPKTNGDLVFGEEAGGAALVSQITAQIALPAFALQALATPRRSVQSHIALPEFGMSLQAVATPRRSVQSHIALPEFGMSLQAVYDINVDRPVANQAAASWQAANHAQASAAALWQKMQPCSTQAEGRWSDADTLAAHTAARHRDAANLASRASARHQDAAKLATQTMAARWQDAQRLRRATGTRWQDAARIRSVARNRWQDNLRRRAGLQTGYSQATACSTALTNAYASARPQRIGLATAWQRAIVPPPGRWVPGVDPVTPPRNPDGDLVFQRPISGGHLVFNWSPDVAATHVIPVRRTYIVFNEVTLRRTDSNTAVQALSLDINIDADSWLPSWSAEVAFSEWPSLAAQNGEPLELEAMINGHRQLLLAEGAPARSRSFGKTSVRLRGRGISAELDAPYTGITSHYNATEMTAQQLMAQALTVNGISMGWDIDWQITDWLVPAGAWSVQATPMGGVLDVAGAVRAIVQADPVDRVLHVLPRYPAAPWDWASLAPDIEIPPDIMQTDSLEPVVRPDYNAIYISGQGHGGEGRVLRSGTAADQVAQMVTHPLLTGTASNRQRGLAELSDTGRQARVTISMPISDDTTLLQVGQLASMPEAADPWRGLIRGVSVSARWQDDAGLIVSQSAELERHYL